MVRALVDDFVAGFRDGWTRFWSVTVWLGRMLMHITSWLKRACH